MLVALLLTITKTLCSPMGTLTNLQILEFLILLASLKLLIKEWRVA